MDIFLLRRGPDGAHRPGASRCPELRGVRPRTDPSLRRVVRLGGPGLRARPRHGARAVRRRAERTTTSPWSARSPSRTPGLRLRPRPLGEFADGHHPPAARADDSVPCAHPAAASRLPAVPAVRRRASRSRSRTSPSTGAADDRRPRLACAAALGQTPSRAVSRRPTRVAPLRQPRLPGARRVEAGDDRTPGRRHHLRRRQEHRHLRAVPGLRAARGEGRAVQVAEHVQQLDGRRRSRRHRRDRPRPVGAGPRGRGSSPRSR